MAEGNRRDNCSLEERMREMEKLVHGNGSFGVAAKVELLWRAHWWILTALAYVLGLLTAKFVEVW